MEGPYIPITGERSTDDKSEKDKSTKKKKDLRVPLSQLPEPETKPQPESTPKATSISDQLEALFKGTVETPTEKAETKAPTLEDTVEFVPSPPSEIVQEGPARIEPRQAIEAIDVPLSGEEAREHVVAFDHAAEALHEPLQPGRSETAEDEETLPPTEPSSVTPETVEDMAPPTPEAEPETPAPTAEAGGGDSHEPPHGPEGPSGPTPEDPDPGEPDRAPESPVATLPEWMRPEDASAVGSSSTERVTTAAPVETRVIHEHGGSGLALVVGVIDYFRGRRLRRTQRQQEKHLKQIDRAQAETRDQQYRALNEQARQNRLLQEQLAARPTAAELRTQHAKTPAERLRTAEVANRRFEKFTPPPAERIIEEKPIELPREHHLEHSAWHAIEVDNKTGHAVEAPVLTYGQEFKRELHQETRRQEEEIAAELAGYSAVNTQFSNTQASTTFNASNNATTPTDLSSPQTIRKPLSPTLDPTNVALLVALAVIVLAIIFALVLR